MAKKKKRIKWFTLRHIVYLKNILWQFYKFRLLWALVAVSFFALSIYLLNTLFYPNHFWFNFSVNKGVETWFCEQTDMHRLVRHPINTFTNIWYIINAIFFLSKALEDYRKPKSFNLITTYPYYSVLLGIISIYTFLCSTFYHSSLISIASKLDYSAVYSISLFPLMYYSHRILLYWRNKPTNKNHTTEVKIIILVFSLIYILLTFFVPLKHIHYIVFSFILLTGLGGVYLERVEPQKSNPKYFVLMLVFISIAIALFKMDSAKIACDPESFFQPHSLWHVFNSMTVFFIYLYFRSENYKRKKDKKAWEMWKALKKTKKKKQ